MHIFATKQHNNLYIKMKKTLSILFACLLLLSSCSQNSGPTCYYLDATNGDDSNSGTSPSKAWKTIARTDGLELRPGEQLLLKRGESFVGNLNIYAHGNADSLVTVGAYGDGALPVISAPDSSLYAIKVKDSEYIILKCIEIVNTGSEEMPGRTGVLVDIKEYGVAHNVTLDSLYIHDVNGSRVKQIGGCSAVNIVYNSKETPSRFDGLLIQNCHIARCQRNALIWEGASDRENWFPSTNVIVRKNLIEEVPGDGIVPILCDGCLIEYNIMRNCPETLPDTEAAAGFWPWSCDNTVIQFNEVSDHKAPWDAQAYDSDYNCQNTTIQYNYSHDNYGGLVLICNCNMKHERWNIGNQNTLIQYNLSINDGLRPIPARGSMFSPSIHFGGHATNTRIYRNIIHQNVKPAKDIDTRMIVSDSWNGYADSTYIEENVFYAASPSAFEMTKSTNNFFKKNYLIGNYKNAPERANNPAALAIYKEYVLDKGSNGFEGLSMLLEEKTICGAKGHFVNKYMIQEAFGLISTN